MAETAARHPPPGGAYDFQRIEKRWRDYWLAEGTYRTVAPGEEGYDPQKPRCYILDMFPYPSGEGLHIGHPKGYIASDIYSRFKRMAGYNVLHPMGFDSFGLPAEQYAIEHNVHPAVSTDQCIDRMRAQLQYLGLGYDWDREISTSHEDYYRWTQWIFLQLFDSWYDPDREWHDSSGRSIRGRARPIPELVQSFEDGTRSLTVQDRISLLERRAGGSVEAGWQELTEAERQAVLSNYRVAYQKEVTVNWCPGLGTVLANEEVTAEGRSEIGDHPVHKRPLKQWMLRITAFADRLLEDLDAEALPDGRGATYALDWPAPIKLMQRNWTGRSEGAEVRFDVDGSHRARSTLEVFTTRPDTLFGATFMVVAPQHPLLSEAGRVPDTWPLETPETWKGEPGAPSPREAVRRHAAWAERSAFSGSGQDQDKSGVFTGIFARRPMDGERIPIFTSDYVSMEYGTGAIMAVPAHDERDHAFALKYGIPVIQVVEPPPEAAGEFPYTGDGRSINSPGARAGDPAGEAHPFSISGLPTAEAKSRIVEALEQAGLGRSAVSYRLRDWVFSRQRYWGEPFPLATHPDGYTVATGLPVRLPEREDFRPTTSEDPDTPLKPPLGRAGREWTQVEVDGQTCDRELNVMPQWAGSCWYFLRFIDPHNDRAFCDPDKERSFMPVDLYIGGAEHAVLHLLYARFWHKALFDLGHVSSPEPFKKQFSQGMVTADAFTDHRGVYIDIRQVAFDANGEPVHAQTGQRLTRFRGKMGKRYKNGPPPEEVGEEYGVDTLRLYEMYMGPLEQSAPWSMEGIRGMQRVLQRIWRNLVAQDGSAKIDDGPAPDGLRRLLHRTTERITSDLEALRFNTAIAALIELNNELVPLERVPAEVARTLILLLHPLAPHLGEELWERCGFGSGDLSAQPWPDFDEALTRRDTIVLPVQVNGKVRATIEVPATTSEEAVRQQVLGLENIQRHLPDSGQIKRLILVPGRIVNIVV